MPGFAQSLIHAMGSSHTPIAPVCAGTLVMAVYFNMREDEDAPQEAFNV